MTDGVVQKSKAYENQSAEVPLKVVDVKQLRPRPQIRDQGVGGSNPLSPTNIFNNLQAFSRLPKTRCTRFCTGQNLKDQQADLLRGNNL